MLNHVAECIELNLDNKVLRRKVELVVYDSKQKR